MERTVARTKQLNASGIKKATLNLVLTDENAEILEMTVVGPDDDNYNYEVYEDERQGSISGIMSRLQSALEQAASDYSRVKISEDKDRFYLHVDIQGSTIQQYSGRRLPD
jgi:ubiquitin-protein ligase